MKQKSHGHGTEIPSAWNSRPIGMGSESPAGKPENGYKEIENGFTSI
ncbi:MAG: hypothetical protein J6K31_06380 [Parabacteroides sp.]|nr:hypothetical protein [Parabacteroides sp.]